MENGYHIHFRRDFSLGAAVLSSVALYARQPIIIAYIALGVALGPVRTESGLRYGVGVRCGDTWGIIFPAVSCSASI